MREFFDFINKCYMYFFIVCINCGFRFMIIEDFFYDCENMMMKEFLMCDFCWSEYEDFFNRCYYVELMVCFVCGFLYRFYISDG